MNTTNTDYQTITPPTDNFSEVILYRAAFQDFVEVYIGESSYIMLWWSFVDWFKKICPDMMMRERVQNYIWNLRCAKFFPEENRMIPWKKEDWMV